MINWCNRPQRGQNKANERFGGGGGGGGYLVNFLRSVIFLILKHGEYTR